jgi:hypothetical protein
MLLDLLEKGQINTFRSNDLDLLMGIRRGEYSINNYEAIYTMLNDFEKRVEYAKKNTSIPKTPNYKRIQELLVEINSNSL